MKINNTKKKDMEDRNNKKQNKKTCPIMEDDNKPVAGEKWSLVCFDSSWQDVNRNNVSEVKPKKKEGIMRESNENRREQ